MYKFVYGFLLVIVLGSSGCSDWLDVQPKTSVPEEDLFADEFILKWESLPFTDVS